MQHKTCTHNNYLYIIQKMRIDSLELLLCHFCALFTLNMGNLNMLKERNPKACLTKGCFAGCHTRWRGLESHLLE